MYQLEVKRWLISKLFPPKEGWKVTVDIDAMERGVAGNHPSDKQAHAEACEAWLRDNGVEIASHPLYGRADLVATHISHGTFVVEVEGSSSRQMEQAMYSALGQVLLSMGNEDSRVRYGVAVPDTPEWELQFQKIPSRVLKLLTLNLFLVSCQEVREFQAE